MHNAALIRSLIIYAIILPLAVVVGYQLTEPLGQGTFFLIGLVVLALCFPILLRWHHLVLVASWNVLAVMFFLPGQPHIWLPLTGLSLCITVLQRSVNRDMRLINVPLITVPLVLMALVVLITAQLTGGIGLRSFGGDVYGGKRYVYLLGAILGYFALSAQQIPKEKAGLYVAAFCLGGVTGVFGDLFMAVSPAFEFIFWVFPPNLYTYQEGFVQVGASRLGGLKILSTAVFTFMLSRYGIRGIVSFKSPWRVVVLFIVVFVGMLGGFRSMVVFCAGMFLIQFFLEGLHKTKLFPITAVACLMLAVITIPLASKMPYQVQRSLALIPYLDVDPVARMDADGTTEWRKQMWRAVVPQIPDYLYLGKGYALSPHEFDTMRTRSEGGEFSFAQNWDAAIVGDYHNGPISVMLTFGIWGAIAFLWFILAGLRVLYANFHHGPPELKTFNVFLLAVFVTKTAIFLFVVGGLHSDMIHFAGFLGLSVSLNGGVCKPATATSPAVSKIPELAVAGTRPRAAFP